MGNNKREKCVYCGEVIKTRSKEHIIQNAIGGLYESEDICCSKCNNFISQAIDAPFTQTFNAIISIIPNFTKTNNEKSIPSCRGQAYYKGSKYSVIIKGKKVIACPELSKKEKRNLNKEDYESFQILSYDFNIDNQIFRNGMCKIAFNYALDAGIDVDKLIDNVDITCEHGKVKEIMFKNLLIPFVPLNSIDIHLELETDVELYHNLILFSQDNNLWCYIDLFNTFQYYVLLSNKWNAKNKIHKSYFQYIQKIDRTVEEIYIRKPKDILTVSQMYNIEPTLDLDEFKKRIKTAIQKESQKKCISEVLSWKMLNNYLNSDEIKNMSKTDLSQKLKYICLYFDENDTLIEQNFRTVTFLEPSLTDIVSYPSMIQHLIENGMINPKVYTFTKFERLNCFLIDVDRL